VFTVGLDTSGLDPEFKSHAHRGIGRYVSELWRYLGSQDLPDMHLRAFDHRQVMQGSWANKVISYLPAGRATARQQLLYPARLSSKGMREFDIIHFPAHMDGPTWSVKPVVLTVLDLIPLVCADLYKAKRATWRFQLARWLELRAIKHASLVLAISENTARDVERVLKIPADRIVVTPLGVDQKFFSVESRRSVLVGEKRIKLLRDLKIPEGRPIILYIGGIDPRKNVPFMLKALRELNNQRRLDQLPAALLFMAGKVAEDREYPELQKAIADGELLDDVILGGYVPDELLLDVLGISDAFFFASLYEGFGLPVLEAMAAGVTVVCAQTSSLPEVLGGFGFEFEPSSLEQAVAGLKVALTGGEICQEHRVRARERARRFTWEETGRRTVEAYRYAAKLQNLHSAIASGGIKDRAANDINHS